jgi:hypothetical protein
MENKEWAKLQEALLAEQLKIIRRFLREKEGDKPVRRKGMSKIHIVKDILQAAAHPLTYLKLSNALWMITK